MFTDNEFGIFIQDNAGPLWKGFFANLDEAKRKAQELAVAEGFESFVYSFKKYREVERFFPVSRKSASPQKS